MSKGNLETRTDHDLGPTEIVKQEQPPINRDTTGQTYSDLRPWIDKGWAWVIVAGSFAVNYAALGQMRCIGIHFIEIQSIFEESTAIVSIMPSVIYFLMPASCLLSSTLTSCFGSRPVALCGIVLIALAYASLAFASHIAHVIIFFSIPFGIGDGIVYASTIVLLSKYFVKYRSTAQGVSMAGFSLAGITIPLLISLIKEEFGFRGTMVIIGGILLQTAIPASLFRPPEYWERELAMKHGRKKNNLVKHPLIDNTQTNHQTSGAQLSRSQSHETVLESSGRKVKPERRLFLSVMDLSDVNSSHRTEIGSMIILGHEVRASKLEIDYLEEQAKEMEQVEAKMQGKQLLLHRLKTSIQWSVLKDVPFLIHLVVAICGFIGFQITYTVLPAHAEDLGFSRKDGYFLITVACIGEFPARILLSFVADKWSATKWGHRFHIMSLCMCISGLGVFMIAFATSYTYLVLGSVVVAFFCAGGFLAIHVDVLRDVIGLEKLTNGGLGLYLFFQGITLSSSTMLMGLLRDWLGNYKLPYVMIGCLTIAGGLLTWLQLLPRRKRRLTRDVKASVKIVNCEHE